MQDGDIAHWKRTHYLSFLVKPNDNSRCPCANRQRLNQRLALSVVKSWTTIVESVRERKLGGSDSPLLSCYSVIASSLYRGRRAIALPLICS